MRGLSKLTRCQYFKNDSTICGEGSILLFVIAPSSNKSIKARSKIGLCGAGFSCERSTLSRSILLR